MSEVLENDAGWVLATRGRLIVTVWRIDVTRARVDAVDSAIRRLVPRCGKLGYGSITVLEPSVSMRMPDDARAASTALQRRWATDMKCSGYLVEGTGFLPAAVRTMTAGLALFTRSSCPIRVFRDGPSISEWVGPFVGTSAIEIARTLMECRSA